MRHIDFIGSYDDGDARIGQRLKSRVPAKMMPDAIKRILSFYQEQRTEDEPFKEFVARLGAAAFEPVVADYKGQVGELSRETIGTYMDWDKTVIYKLERGEGECAI